ncbi:MAG TPA: phosphatase PAP2 family protein [Polyangiaceae bacterium]|nr:phosphatase PAP2 family protein [Polyangiaceae bacterium]
MAVTGTNLYFQYGTGAFPDQRWNSPILFDEWARGIRADTPEGRRRVAEVSDYMWHGTQYYTVVVDSLLVPLAFDRFNLDVALQMNLLNWQAIGLSFFILRLTHVTVGRARPSEYGCSNEPGARFPCVKGRGPSFMGGHVAMAATGAGLACAHHNALPLYGGGWPDIAACVVLSASAVTVGVLRGVADKHWASDNILGGLVGGAIGFGLPYLLHYRYGHREGFAAGRLGSRLVVAPLVSDDVWGVGVSGFL